VSDQTPLQRTSERGEPSSDAGATFTQLSYLIVGTDAQAYRHEDMCFEFGFRAKSYVHMIQIYASSDLARFA